METSNDPLYNKVNFFIIVKGGAAELITFVENVFGAKENKKARIPDKDGTLIHAEVQLYDSMILIADSNEDWPFTPAFPQVYVENAQHILDKAEKAGAKIISKVTDIYAGMKLARFQDSWGNIWWLFEKGNIPTNHSVSKAMESNTDWHDQKPSYSYTSLMDAMKNLKDGRR